MKHYYRYIEDVVADPTVRVQWRIVQTLRTLAWATLLALLGACLYFAGSYVYNRYYPEWARKPQVIKMIPFKKAPRFQDASMGRDA